MAVAPRAGGQAGTTLVEVVVASGLLLVAIVPILEALTIGQTTGTTVERRARSLALAQGKLEEISARAVHHYDGSFREDSVPLDGGYLCTVADDAQTSLRLISVSVGYDENGDHRLAERETAVKLTTYMARRG